jgi:hypothetical protein
MSFGFFMRNVLVGMLAAMIGFAPLAVEAAEKGVPCPDSAKSAPPIIVKQGGETRSIHLCRAFDFHGNACPGATMTYMAVRYGLELLHEDGEIPDLDDLVVIGRAPGGPMDLLDLIMKGEDRAGRTWPPEGIESGAENFSFQFFRKSTMRAVTVRLRDGLWPADWFELRDKNRDGSITEAESEKRQRDRQYVIREYPRKTYSELFDEPEVHAFVAWGGIGPGEIDRRIRDLRRSRRRAAAEAVEIQ